MYSSKLEDIMVECSLLLVMTQLSLEHLEPALSSQFHSFLCDFVFPNYSLRLKLLWFFRQLVEKYFGN